MPCFVIIFLCVPNRSYQCANTIFFTEKRTTAIIGIWKIAAPTWASDQNGEQQTQRRPLYLHFENERWKTEKTWRAPFSLLRLSVHSIVNPLSWSFLARHYIILLILLELSVNCDEPQKKCDWLCSTAAETRCLNGNVRVVNIIVDDIIAALDRFFSTSSKPYLR